MKHFALDVLRPVAALLVGACFVVSANQADWVLPPWANAQLGGCTVSLGYSDLQLGGMLILAGGKAAVARNVQVTAGAVLNLGSGSVELARQWTNQGSGHRDNGKCRQDRERRMPDGEVCGAGTADNPRSNHRRLARRQQRRWQRPGAGERDWKLRGDPPQRADQKHSPLVASELQSPFGGGGRFTGSACNGTTLTAQVTYPAGSLSGLSVRKYGPSDSPTQTGWFTPAGLTISTGQARTTPSLTSRWYSI